MDHVANNSVPDRISSDKKNDVEKFFSSYFLHNPEIYGDYMGSNEHQEFIQQRRIQENE